MTSKNRAARLIARARERPGVRFCLRDAARITGASLGLALPLFGGLDAIVTPPPGLPTTSGQVGQSRNGPLPVPTSAGVAIVQEGGARLHERPGEGSRVWVPEGTALGFRERSGRWLRVTSPCDTTVWVHEDDVAIVPRAQHIDAGPGFPLAQGVVVIDAGHGGASDPGAVGPRGLVESVVNLDIAKRLRALLLESHDVDWDTGEITTGTRVPALKAAFQTRATHGLLGGDYEAGLGYRAALANAAGAHAFVSIHNNGGPTMPRSQPGTEVYYSVAAADSDRLGSLIHEELLRSFSAYDARWGGGSRTGAQARIDPATGRDFYGVLRRARVPAVIVEGLYITQPEEESLLGSSSFRTAYAEGVYRGIVRFLTTRELGSRIYRPVPFSGAVGASHAHCAASPPHVDAAAGQVEDLERQASFSDPDSHHSVPTSSPTIQPLTSLARFLMR